jgi:hypothetical protein
MPRPHHVDSPSHAPVLQAIRSLLPPTPATAAVAGACLPAPPVRRQQTVDQAWAAPAFPGTQSLRPPILEIVVVAAAFLEDRQLQVPGIVLIRPGVPAHLVIRSLRPALARIALGALAPSLARGPAQTSPSILAPLPPLLPLLDLEVQVHSCIRGIVYQEHGTKARNLIFVAFLLS